MLKTFQLTGPLADADLDDLLATVRRIDARRPDQRFEVLILDADGTLADAESYIRRAFPTECTGAVQVIRFPS
jgi:hypothetical protein